MSTFSVIVLSDGRVSERLATTAAETIRGAHACSLGAAPDATPALAVLSSDVQTGSSFVMTCSNLTSSVAMHAMSLTGKRRRDDGEPLSMWQQLSSHAVFSATRSGLVHVCADGDRTDVLDVDGSLLQASRSAAKHQGDPWRVCRVLASSLAKAAAWCSKVRRHRPSTDGDQTRDTIVVLLDRSPPSSQEQSCSSSDFGADVALSAALHALVKPTSDTSSGGRATVHVGVVGDGACASPLVWERLVAISHSTGGSVWESGFTAFGLLSRIIGQDSAALHPVMMLEKQKRLIATQYIVQHVASCPPSHPGERPPGTTTGDSRALKRLCSNCMALLSDVTPSGGRATCPLCS